MAGGSEPPDGGGAGSTVVVVMVCRVGAGLFLLSCAFSTIMIAMMIANVPSTPAAHNSVR